MHSVSKTFVLFLFVASTSAFSVGYRAYSSRDSCDGDNFYCADDGNICCNYPPEYGYSVGFEKLPTDSRGQGFSNANCSQQSALVTALGPGNKCWVGNGLVKAKSLTWIPPAYSKSLAADIKNKCSAPSRFGYRDQDGTWREIKLMPGDDMEEAYEVAELYKKKDFKALSYWPSA